MFTISPILLLAGRFILASALLMVLYWAVWRKQAVYRAKRFYLLTLPVVSLLIALTQVEVYKPEPQIVTVEAPAGMQAASPMPAMTAENPVTTVPEVLPTTFSEVNEIDTNLLALAAYTLILIVLAIPFVVNFFQVKRLSRQVEEVKADSSEADIRILTGRKVKAPFSFHRDIFLPLQLTEAQRRVILCHERAHIMHRHYLEVWIIEGMTRLFWWNPILWWCRKELRNVHEFEADSEVLATGEDLLTYQTILVEEVMHGDIIIANGFNHSFIRRRFIEMTESSSRRMTSLAKAGTTAWMLLVVALMCCTVGEAETIYKSTPTNEVSSDDNDKEESEPAVTDSIMQSAAVQVTELLSKEGAILQQLWGNMNELEELSPEQYEELKRSVAPRTLPSRESINRSIRGMKEAMLTFTTEAMTGQLTGLAQLMNGMKKTVDTTFTVKVAFTEEISNHPSSADTSPSRNMDEWTDGRINFFGYKKLAETDATAKQQYDLLMECISEANTVREKLMKKAYRGDKMPRQTEVEAEIKAEVQEIFDKAGIALRDSGTYRLPDGTIVRENDYAPRMTQPVEYHKAVSRTDKRPFNAPPVMERQKSPNYAWNNVDTWPRYYNVHTIGNHEYSETPRVYRGKDCTYVVTDNVVGSDIFWIYFSSDTYLLDPHTDKKYPVIYAEHIPLDTYFWIHGQRGYKVRFVKVFPPLPDDVTTVDLIPGNIPADELVHDAAAPSRPSRGLKVEECGE